MPLPVTGLATAFLNDVNGEMIYARQLYGYGKRRCIYGYFRSSGNAENVMYAVAVAKASGIKTIGLPAKTGEDGGSLRLLHRGAFDETFKIQELHLPIYHTCA